MGRPRIYAEKQVRVYLTPEHQAEIKREATLTGTTTSAVVRAALSAYFERPEARAS